MILVTSIADARHWVVLVITLNLPLARRWVGFVRGRASIHFIVDAEIPNHSARSQASAISVALSSVSDIKTSARRKYMVTRCIAASDLLKDFRGKLAVEHLRWARHHGWRPEVGGLIAPSPPGMVCQSSFQIEISNNHIANCSTSSRCRFAVHLNVKRASANFSSVKLLCQANRATYARP